MDAAVVIAFAVLIAVVATLLLRAMTGDKQEVARTLQCPVLDQPARCVLVRDVRTGRLTTVSQCSLWPPGAAPCAGHCARLLEAGADLTPRDEAKAARR